MGAKMNSFSPERHTRSQSNYNITCLWGRQAIFDLDFLVFTNRSDGQNGRKEPVVVNTPKTEWREQSYADLHDQVDGAEDRERHSDWFQELKETIHRAKDGQIFQTIVLNVLENQSTLSVRANFQIKSGDKAAIIAIGVHNGAKRRLLPS